MKFLLVRSFIEAADLIEKLMFFRNGSCALCSTLQASSSAAAWYTGWLRDVLSLQRAGSIQVHLLSTKGLLLTVVATSYF